MERFSKKIFLALGISLVFGACNNADKKTEETATDTTKTETMPPKDATPDAVTAAPNLYKVLADSLGIRVLEVNYNPGDSSAMHSHPDNALYVISSGTGEFTGKDGMKNQVELKPGMTSIRPGETHSVKSVGKTTMKAILVEVSRANNPGSGDMSMESTKVAPDLYKTAKDTMGIRIVEVAYKPGQSSAMHSHSDYAIYVISGGSGEFTEKDGTKRTAEFKTGMTMIRGGESHSVKNTGKTTLRVLLVEVNRAR